jgi:hypothetical protein
MLSVSIKSVMLRVVKLSVIVSIVIMLIVVAPYKGDKKLWSLKRFRNCRDQNVVLTSDPFQLLMFLTQVFKLCHRANGKVFFVFRRSKLVRNNFNCQIILIHETGNTKGGSITVPLTSCLTGLD